MAIAPIVALVALWGDWSSAPFVLTAIGLAIVIVGVYVVSNVWKEPLYDVILASDPEAMPAGWEAARVVTATNGAGSRSATSAASAAVVKKNPPKAQSAAPSTGQVATGSGATRTSVRSGGRSNTTAFSLRRQLDQRGIEWEAFLASHPAVVKVFGLRPVAGTGSASSAVPACGCTCFATASATPAGLPGTPMPPASCWPTTQ
jgi:hypothetical protein